MYLLSQLLLGGQIRYDSETTGFGNIEFISDFCKNRYTGVVRTTIQSGWFKERKKEKVKERRKMRQ